MICGAGCCSRTLWTHTWLRCWRCISAWPTTAANSTRWLLESTAHRCRPGPCLAQKSVQQHTVGSAQHLMRTLCTDYVEVSWQGTEPLDRSAMSRRFGNRLCVIDFHFRMHFGGHFDSSCSRAGLRFRPVAARLTACLSAGSAPVHTMHRLHTRINTILMMILPYCPCWPAS